MKDKDKTKEQLVSELEEARHRIAELEVLDTERKKAETEFQTIVRTAMDGFWLADMQGHFLDVNDAYCHLTGYSRDELLNMSILDIEAIEKPEETTARIRKIKEVGQDRFETRHRRKDGAFVDVEISVNYLPTDEGQMFVFIRDITERKQSEERIEHLNLVLRAIRNVNQLITRESNPRKLIQGACDTLIETRGYAKACLILVDKSEKPLEYSGSGWGKDFLPLAERLENGELTVCGRKALKQSGVVKIMNPPTECADCPVSSKYAGMGAMTVRMERAERVWGVLSASIPLSMMTDEEVSLFSEVARDIAFALHDIELGEQRRRAEQNFRNSLDNSPLGVRIVTAGGELLYANQALLDIYGYSSLEELKSTPIKQRYTPESYVEHRRRAEDRKRGKPAPDNYEIGIIRKDGEVRYLQVFRREVTWNGETRFQAIYQDITERKQAEEELIRFKTIANVAPYGVGIAADLDGTMTYVNEAFALMHGYAPDEIIGQRFPIFYTEKQLGAVEKLRKRCLETGSFVGEDVWRMRKDGTVFPSLMSMLLVRDDKGKPLYISSTVIDVTERKKSEEALADEATRRRILIEQSRDGIVILDQDGKVYESNQRFADMLGYSIEEVLQLHVFDWEFQFTREQVLEMVWSVDEAGDHFETQHRRKDGTIYDVEISTNGAVFAGQKLIFCVCRDITERKQMEQDRQTIERLESIGTLAGGIAHDFNNLLTGIMGNIGLAKRHIEPGSKAEERLTEAERASYRARDLTQQLLTFATGGTPIKKAISIGGLVRDTIEFALTGSNVRPEFSLPDDLWATEADEGQLNQVISNIIINADQAMPQGGIINVEAKNLVISRRGTLPLPRGNYLEIIIKDYGAGIAKEHLTRIFEPFFTTKQKGSGLGLATAYSIVNKHGGHITVESKLGAGTTVYVYLPASKETALLKDEVTEEAVLVGKGRILVMDDEEMIREMLGNMLSTAGYEVELTSNGAEAVERYSKAKEAGQPFDAIILDITVPGGMGGKEAIKKLLELDPDVKAIVSSGYATDPIMSEYKEYGFSAVVTKPYSVAQIEKTLHSLLREEK